MTLMSGFSTNLSDSVSHTGRSRKGYLMNYNRDRCMLIPTLYSRFCTFSSHQNQELSTTECQTNIDSENFAKTLMFRARPRPSSSNQFVKRPSLCDKFTEAIFPVDFPVLTPWTGKCICPHASCVSKTVLHTSCVRVFSFSSAPHWEHHKISALKPKTMTVKVWHSRGKSTPSRLCLGQSGRN